MGLLAAPAPLGGGGEVFEGGVRGVVREVDLALPRCAVFADEPAPLARQMLRASRDRPIGNAHAPCAECGPQRPLRAGPPGQRPERPVRRIGEQRRHRCARRRGHGVLAGAAAPCPGFGHRRRHVGREHLLVRRDAERPTQARPVQPALSSACRNSATLPYSASPSTQPTSTQPNRTPPPRRRPISSSAIRHLGRKAIAGGTPTRSRRRASPPKPSGRTRRSATGIGTSPRANVSVTSAWQFARLAPLAAVLALHADRVPPLLDQRRAVHNEYGISTAHQRLGPLNQDALQPLPWPGRGGEEVVQLLKAARANPRRHRRHALALARQQQTTPIHRRPAPLLHTWQRCQERLKPTLQPPRTHRRANHKPIRGTPPPRVSPHQRMTACNRAE